MDAKKKKEYLKALQRIEAKHTQPTNEMSLIDKGNELLSLLIRILLEQK